MEKLNARHTFWDTWRAPRDGYDAIVARQQRRLAEMVTFARTHSRFYAEKYQGLPEQVTDVRRLPVLSKRALMARFDAWVTDPAVTRAQVDAFVADRSQIGHPFLGKYTVCTTSGTTGVPAALLYDAGMFNVIGALNVGRATPAWLGKREVKGLLRGGARMALIHAREGHFLGAAMAQRQILERPSRAKKIRLFSVLTPLDDLVRELNAFQPAMLNGYATAVALLAEEQAAGRLQIHPSLILTSSESLPPEARAQIAATFNTTVRDNYGCSEFVAIAYDCGHGWLHANADWTIIEPVDENYNPVPPGQTSSSLLITNLANRVQPILRYELGDRVLVSPDPCPCGSPLPAIRVEGRTDDVLRLKTAVGASVPLLPLAIWSVVKETPGVGRFQVVQTAPSHLEIRLEAKHLGEEEAVWQALAPRMTAYLSAQGLANVTLARSPLPPQRDAKSGKFRHVWAEI